MRDLFIAPPNHKVLGYDGSNLEQFVAASYAFPYDNGYYAEMLKGDAHTTNAKAYSIAAGREVKRGEGKGITYACVPTDNSEVLTRDGWKSYEQLVVGEEVLSCNADKDVYEWVPIEHLWFYEDAPVVTLGNAYVSLESTANHRWLGEQRRMKGSRQKAERWYEVGYKMTSEINSEFRIKHASLYSGDGCVTPEEAALVGWLLSDGYYKWSEISDGPSTSFGKRRGVVASICQAEHKYCDEIEDVLKQNEIRYTKHNKNTGNKNEVFSYLLSSEDMRNFLDFVVGNREPKHEVDWVKWVLSLSQEAIQSFLHNFWLGDGHMANGNQKITQNAGNICDAVILGYNLIGRRVIVTKRDSSCNNLSINKGCYTTGQRLTKGSQRTTDVFCLTNRNSNFVMRQNGFITITGNCLYGAQAKKIGKMLGVPTKKAQAVIDAFWDTNYGLRELKKNLELYWESTGSRYIRGIDGRKIYTRSKHSLVNALFQSCGSLIMFKSGIFMYQMLRDHGISHQDCIRLAFVHDEFQYQVADGLIETFTFETEEEAKEFSYGDKLLSNVRKVDGKYNRYYSLVGELGDKSLQMAGEFYNMPLPFNAAYDVGLSLAETH